MADRDTDAACLSDREAALAAMLELGPQFTRAQELPRQVLLGPARPTRRLFAVAFSILLSTFLVYPWLLRAPDRLPGAREFLVSASMFLCGVLLALLAALVALQFGALLLASRGHVRSAFRVLNFATNLCGTTAPYILVRGMMLHGCHFTEEAVEYLRSMWSKIKTSELPQAKATLGTGLVLLERDLDEAEAMLREVLAARPQWRELHLPLGMALYLTDRYDEALTELEAAADLIPKLRRMRKEPLYFALGECSMKAGKRDAAAVWFKKSREEGEARRRFASARASGAHAISRHDNADAATPNAARR